MHFINRDGFEEAPLAKLTEFNNNSKEAWAIYNTARINKTKPLPAKPSSSWNHNDIRYPLRKLFLKNCGYCGVHTDIGNDAEVDHFFPTSLDGSASHVFNWNNYIWSCPSCNGQKGSKYPFLNPTLEDEVKHIYFHSPDGRYLLSITSPDEIISKYNLTQQHSDLNSKNKPDNRKYIFRDVNRRLEEIEIDHMMYTLESSINGEDSKEALVKRESLENKKDEFFDLIRNGNHLFLIKFTVDDFIVKNEGFPYTFDEFLEGSGYLAD